MLTGSGRSRSDLLKTRQRVRQSITDHAAFHLFVQQVVVKQAPADLTTSGGCVKRLRSANRRRPDEGNLRWFMGSNYDMKVYGGTRQRRVLDDRHYGGAHSLAAPPRIHKGDDAFYILERTVELLAGTRAVEGFFSLTTTSLQGSRSRRVCLPDPLDCNRHALCWVRLSRGPVVSIASTQGHATGVGSELALACDMRFCEWRKSHLVAVEVGAGLVPGQRGHRGNHGLGWLYRPTAEHEQVSDNRDPATADGMTMMMMVCMAWPKLRIDNNG